jgi:acid phosphatase type 7
MLKRYILTLAIPLLLSLNGYAQDDFKITHGPYLSDMSNNGVTIMWMTNNKATAWVELAPDDQSNFYTSERPKFFDTKLGRIQATSTLHKVRLEHLTPGTKYRYAIFSREVLNSDNDARILYGTTVANRAYSRNPLSFTTFSNNADTVSFLMLNDIHGNSQMMKDMCKDVDFKSIDMVVFNGDMSSSITGEEQLFTDYIDAAVEMFASRIPIVFNRGNHETRGSYSSYILNYFPLKDGTVYRTFYVGNVAFLMLDCGEDKPDSDIEYSGLADYDAYRLEQAAWLKDVIKNNKFKDAQTKIVLLHMPPSVSNWHGNLHLTETVMPLLNEAKVNVMFSGHTHRYSMNPPVEGITTFPVIVNSNNTCLRCDIINGKIRVRILGAGTTKPMDYMVN